jgi:hypothetical protein
MAGKSFGGISAHFKREVKIMIGIPIVLIILGFIAAFVGPLIIQHLK